MRLALALRLLSATAAVATAARADAPFRPPAVPLVACDPYFSIWSEADHLTDDATRHWTRAKHELVSMIRVDGKTYRLMGDEPKNVPPLQQTAVTVTPTRSIYAFRSPEVVVDLVFTQPALPDDLEVLARPLTYLTWDAQSADARPHRVSVYFSVSAELAVNTMDEAVVWRHENVGDMDAMRAGTEDQPVLERSGDDMRIDWGYAYVAAPPPVRSAAAVASQRGGVPIEPNISRIASQAACLTAFAQNGRLPNDDKRMPRPAKDETPAMAVVMDLGEVRERPVSRVAMVAYDDVYSIDYFGTYLRGYWRRNGMDMEGLLRTAERDYSRLEQRCAAFDRALTTDLTRVGGPKYAQICALAYRQSLAACKLAADAKGMPMLFPKENTSNGCISTVDVIYPMDPMYIFFGPMLAKATLAPVLNYTASPQWRYSYAPHDLGTYPLATRQVYAADDDPAHEGDRMPVEESGNMILLLAAVAREEGSPEFASQYWPQVTKWAHYLEAKGFDPENQLCTDDFTGHLAHNANLSVKAIEALAAYGMLCGMRGDQPEAERYHAMARDMAKKWVAAADDGDHFRLAFDKPGTWSQKYNMVWDKLLGLDVFGPAVIHKEMAFYLKTEDPYGLALDNRKPYAKIDWSLWTATMADSRADFDRLTSPIYAFLNHTPERNPITDLYWTKRGSEVGMHARSVVGGLFIRMLAAPAVWRKWAGREPNSTAATDRWAPLPTPPTVAEVVPTAQREAVPWRYTVERPAEDWYKPGFDASGWKEGSGGFGTAGTPGAVVRTDWHTDDIWLRRDFDMPAGAFKDLRLRVYHDEDVEVYVDGILAGRAPGFGTDYVLLPIRPAARAALTPGRHVLAVHCHQTTGGQGVDVGIVAVGR